MLISASHLLQRSGLLLAVGLSALALNACGSDSDDAASPSGSGSAGAATTANDQDTARVKLTQCLRENGVDVPDNVGQAGPGPDVDPDELQAALDGPCKKFQAGAFGDAGGEDNQEFQDAYNVFAECMRQNGVDARDLGPNDGPPQIHGLIDQDDPDFADAQEKCQDKLPQGGPGGGH